MCVYIFFLRSFFVKCRGWGGWWPSDKMCHQQQVLSIFHLHKRTMLVFTWCWDQCGGKMVLYSQLYIYMSMSTMNRTISNSKNRLNACHSSLFFSGWLSEKNASSHSTQNNNDNNSHSVSFSFFFSLHYCVVIFVFFCAVIHIFFLSLSPLHYLVGDGGFFLMFSYMKYHI